MKFATGHPRAIILPVFLVLLAGGVAMSGYGKEGERKVKIACSAAAGVDPARAGALCEALKDVLRAGDPPWAVTENAAATGIDLTVLAAGKQGMTARLSWQGADAAGTSPEMGFDVTDRALSPAMFPRFVQQLLKQADWPG